MSRLLIAAGFVVAGVLHFTATDSYVRIVPAVLPRPRDLVLISGAAEIAGGIGVLLPSTRRLAGLGLVALLVAVFPANVNMALHPEVSPASIPRALLWLRLPLQAALIGLVWHATLRRRA